MSISIALAIKPVKHDPPLELSSFFGDNTLIPAVTASLFSRNQISMDRVVDTIGCTGCTNSLQRAINDVVARFVVLAYTHTHTHTRPCIYERRHMYAHTLTLGARIHLHCRNETTMQIQYLRRDGMIMPKWREPRVCLSDPDA